MPLIYKPSTASGITINAIAQVSVYCEMCGTTYGYEYPIYGYDSSARQAALDDLASKIKCIEAGDYSDVADHRPCPQCGYVQSWMIEPARRKRGWQGAAGIALAACLIAILAMALIAPDNIRNDAGVGLFIVFGIPVILFFLARVVIMKAYRPNRAIAPRANTPSISFRYR